MSKEEIKFFIDEIYQNRDMFISVNGVSNANNSHYMLVSDVVTEHSELFADIITEAMKTKNDYASYTQRTANALRA